MLKSKENSAMDRMGDLNTLIGKGSIFEGNLNVQHSLRIDGRLIGNIKSTDSIIIGKEGEVDGEIEVKNAVIGGKIKGKVTASGKITLESTSTFNGQLMANKLVIDDGAVFDGTSQMNESNSKVDFQPTENTKKEERSKVK